MSLDVVLCIVLLLGSGQDSLEYGYKPTYG